MPPRTDRIILGDCLAVLPALDPDSFDACVTDPPYGLEFMGMAWDRLGDVRQIGDPTFQVGVFQDGTRYAANVRHGGTAAYRSGGAGAAMQAWHEAWAREVFRVLKPGAHLVAFGGTRTYHRLVCAIEDAGFEIRDSITWMFGSGFPKSLDVSKAIDRAAGAEREVIGATSRTGARRQRSAIDDGAGYTPGRVFQNGEAVVNPATAPATEDAARWDGWGTALKPAAELIVLARKPLSERNIAANVLRWGTGGLNIDSTRVSTLERPAREVAAARLDVRYRGSALAGRVDGSLQSSRATGTTLQGRWPANVILSHTVFCREVGQRTVRSGMGGPQSGGIKGGIFGRGRSNDHPDVSGGYGDELVELWECADDCPVALLDAQSGELTSGKMMPTRPIGRRSVYGQNAAAGHLTSETYGDTGGASRFFYAAKVDAAERHEGLGSRNTHPTVKPLSLMAWLARLVTPPGGVILDPFIGSGTTAIAAIGNGFGWVGVERDASYVEIARQRIGLGCVVE